MRKTTLLTLMTATAFLSLAACNKAPKKETKAPQKANAEPSAMGKKAPKRRAAAKVQVPAFKGALESSPWEVKELGAAGFAGLTMRVPKNAEIKKDPINSKVGNINNTDGFAIWLTTDKLDIAKATKAVQKSGLRPFKGFIEQKPDYLIYKFKGLTETQVYFQVALTVDGKHYTCKALGGITISEKELPQVKQVIQSCKTLKKK